MKFNVKVHKDWIVDLCWCPSQMYYHIEYGCRHWVVYLRWRGGDPWGISIVECPADGKFDMHVLNNWNGLYFDKFFGRDSDIKEIQKDALYQAKKWLFMHVKK